jgi:hypothetical protein
MKGARGLLCYSSTIWHVHSFATAERSLILAHISKIGSRILVKGVKWSDLANHGGKTNQIIVEGGYLDFSHT